MCVLCEHVHACRSAYVEIGGQLTGVDFLLPYESWGLNSGCQAWLRISLPAEPFCKAYGSVFIQKRFSGTWRVVTSAYDSYRGPEFGFHFPGKSTHSCLWLKLWGSLTPSSGLFWHVHPQTHACTQTYIYMQLKIDTCLALWGLGLVLNSA